MHPEDIAPVSGVEHLIFSALGQCHPKEQSITRDQGHSPIRRLTAPAPGIKQTLSFKCF